VTNGAVTAAATWIGINDWTGKPFHSHTRTIEGTDRYACNQVLRDIATRIWIQFPYPAFEPLPVCPVSVPASVADPAPPTACAESRWSIWPDELPMPPLEKPRPDPPPQPERAPLAVRLGATVGPELVADGWGSFGVAVDAGARYRWVSLSAEAHGDPPTGAVSYAQVGAVSFARLSGAILACAHWGWLAACGVGDAGRFIFPDHAQALPASAFYGAAGARLNLEFPVPSTSAFLRVGVDIRAPIDPLRRVVSNVTIFQAAGPSVWFGVGFVAEIPR
jgi:hypothetical protein